MAGQTITKELLNNSNTNLTDIPQIRSDLCHDETGNFTKNGYVLANQGETREQRSIFGIAFQRSMVKQEA